MIRYWFTSMALAMVSQPAWAQETTKKAAGWESFVPLIIIFVVFYLLVIRPQSKRIKEHQQMVASLHRGDRVVTGGGVEGVIKKIYENEDRVDVEIAPDVTIKIVQSTISEVVTRKGEKAEPKAKADKKKK